MGNSEVGHLNLGAGAVVRQDLARIDDALADGSLAANPVLRRRFADAERVHLLGLVSDGGVHSSLEHLAALVARRPRAGGGRPRDPRLHRRARHAAPRRARLPARTRRASRRPRRLGGGALLGDGPRPALGPHPARLRPARPRSRRPTAPTAAPRPSRDAYERGETDEFIEPTLVGGEARIGPRRLACCAFNFRPDRMRQLTRALAEPGLRRGRARSSPAGTGAGGGAAR